MSTPQTKPYDPVTAVRRFLAGNEKTPPIEELRMTVCDAERRVAQTKRKFSEASLLAASGDSEALKVARAELNEAIEAELAAKAAIERARLIASERSREAAIEQRRKEWTATIKLAREREDVVASLDRYIDWFTKELRKLDKINRSMNVASPLSLQSHERRGASFHAYQLPLELALSKAGIIEKRVGLQSVMNVQKPLVEQLRKANEWLEKIAKDDIEQFKETH